MVKRGDEFRGQGHVLRVRRPVVQVLPAFGGDAVSRVVRQNQINQVLRFFLAVNGSRKVGGRRADDFRHLTFRGGVHQQKQSDQRGQGQKSHRAALANLQQDQE